MGRKMRRGFGGGSVFRSPYVPKPINKLASRGIKDPTIRETLAEPKVVEPAKVAEPQTRRLPTKTSPIRTASAKPLPQIAYFRVQYSDAFDRLCKAPWVLLVSCKYDGKGLRLASDVGHEYGVNIDECYKTKAEAIIAGKNMENTWGKGVKG